MRFITLYKNAIFVAKDIFLGSLNVFNILCLINVKISRPLKRTNVYFVKEKACLVKWWARVKMSRIWSITATITINMRIVWVVKRISCLIRTLVFPNQVVLSYTKTKTELTIRFAQNLCKAIRFIGVKLSKLYKDNVCLISPKTRPSIQPNKDSNWPNHASSAQKILILWWKLVNFNTNVSQELYLKQRIIVCIEWLKPVVEAAVSRILFAENV